MGEPWVPPRRFPSSSGGRPPVLPLYAMRLATIVMLCAGLALLTAGCGGSGGGDNQRLSHSEFQGRANHICTKLRQQEQPDIGSTAKSSIDRNLGRIDSAVSDLERLQPPQADQARYRHLLKTFKRTIAFVKAKEPLLIRLTTQMQAHPSDTHLTARYQSLVRPFVRDAQLLGVDANALGLEACATGFTGGGSSAGGGSGSGG